MSIIAESDEVVFMAQDDTLREHTCDMSKIHGKVKGVRRSISITNRTITTLNTLITKTSSPSDRHRLTSSAIMGPKHKGSTIGRPLITRIDVPPPINTAISTFDILDRRRDERSEDRCMSMLSSTATTLSSGSRRNTGLMNNTKLDSNKGRERDSIVSELSQALTESFSSTECPPSPDTCLSSVSSNAITVANSDSARPAPSPSNSSKGEENLEQAQIVSELLDSLFPKLPASILPKPRHCYFNVATLDGYPTIPTKYKCPTSICGYEFLYFESLQMHWSEHPWNRNCVLIPVTAGGIRRLTFWQHKAKYFKSLVHGPHLAQIPGTCDTERRPGTGRRKSIIGLRKSQKAVCNDGPIVTSDYGDIKLFGSRSYFVSPRVVPMDQVRAWEIQRDRRSGFCLK